MTPYKVPFEAYSPYAYSNRLLCCPPSKTSDYTIEVEGRGKVTAQPDIALVTLGVVTENQQVAAAQQENAEIVARVIAELRREGVAEEDIETVFYSVEPQYDFIEGRQIFRGYRVVHNLRVTIRNMARAGQIIDAAVASGANTVGNIDFTVSDSERYYQMALTAASRDALQKALTIASSMGVVLNRVPIRVAETRFMEVVPFERSFAGMPSTVTPIMPGLLEVTAVIQAVYVYGF